MQPITHLQVDFEAVSRRPPDAVVADLLQRLFRDAPQPAVVAIGGPGGTGKSTFARRVADRLPDAGVLTLDDYKTPRADRADQGLYGAHPDANFMDLAHDHLGAIRRGASIDRPVYSIEHGAARHTETYRPRPFNIVDGEISGYPAFAEVVDFFIYIDSDWKTQLQTRVVRDVDVRGYTRDKAIATFLHSNLREFQIHGADSKAHADLHLYCHDDYRIDIESICSDHIDALRAVLDVPVTEVDLAGLMVPVTTPFHVSGEIDLEHFIAHLEWLASAGIHRVLVNGTAGEFFSLTQEEQHQLMLVARQYFPGQVLYQAGREGLWQTRNEIRWATAHGADALLVLPPYYYQAAPAEGLKAYFRELARIAEIPLILYNFPKHTGNPITPDLLQAVPHDGLKDSAGDLSLAPHTPSYFCGDERHVVEAYAAGGRGLVSAMANAFPELVGGLVRDLAGGRNADAPQQTLRELCHAYTDLRAIPAVKALLRTRLPEYPLYTRPPVMAPTAETVDRLNRLAQQALAGHTKLGGDDPETGDTT